ncbi:MAG: hypothetical protein P8Y85_08735, partial [Nitrospirota bacterium]
PRETAGKMGMRRKYRSPHPGYPFSPLPLASGETESGMPLNRNYAVLRYFDQRVHSPKTTRFLENQPPPHIRCMRISILSIKIFVNSWSAKRVY